MSEEKKEEAKSLRQIIIETDGNTARIVKADVAGALELKAILEGLASNLNNSK